ncbi:MAG: hypothetical protein MK052_02100 [Alphaproteobacteria bacterium]|nr:hypothetical protein [Alphaproteobacteria bacterium]
MTASNNSKDMIPDSNPENPSSEVTVRRPETIVFDAIKHHGRLSPQPARYPGL